MNKIILKLAFLVWAVTLNSQPLFASDNGSSDKENSHEEKRNRRPSTEEEPLAKKLKLTPPTEQFTTPPQTNPVLQQVIEREDPNKLPNFTGNISKIEEASLKDVEDYMSALSVPLQNVLLVLDVDGTLTNRSIPSRKTEARGNAVPFVTNKRDEGAYIVVSSSWDNFDETLERLEQLEFQDILKTRSPNSDCGTRTLSVGQLEVEVNYHVAGLVASVQDPTVDEAYYRQKAWAFRFVYPDLDPETIEIVVFADDSSKNIDYFCEDLKRANLFSAAKEIKIFELTQVKGELGAQ